LLAQYGKFSITQTTTLKIGAFKVYVGKVHAREIKIFRSTLARLSCTVGSTFVTTHPNARYTNQE